MRGQLLASAQSLFAPLVAWQHKREIIGAKVTAIPRSVGRERSETAGRECSASFKMLLEKAAARVGTASVCTARMGTVA